MVQLDLPTNCYRPSGGESEQVPKRCRPAIENELALVGSSTSFDDASSDIAPSTSEFAALPGGQELVRLLADTVAVSL
jgi:hypothetical protein